MVHRHLLSLWAYRKILIIFLTPLVLLPLPLVTKAQEAYCGYVIILMAVYWITEALPLAVTSLMPIFLFPMMGILTSKEVSVLYFKDTNWLMFGGLVIGVAVETSGLHKRIALGVLLFVGVKPRWLMLGFMIATFFLSMWISNTATTAMLLPIVEAVIKELYGEGNSESNATTEMEATMYCDKTDEKLDVEPTYYTNDAFTESDDGITRMEMDENEADSEKSPAKTEDISEHKRNLIIKGITICIPYSASIGGTATLTGTVPNLVLSGQYAQLFPENSTPLSFGVWISYCLPQAIVLLIFAYVWMSLWFIGFDVKEIFPCCFKKLPKTERERKAEQFIKQQYKNLGRIKWEEVTVLAVFALTALLWLFRKPGFMPGWSLIFDAGFISDGSVAVFMAFWLFILPKTEPDFLRRLRGEVDKEENEGVCTSVPAVLDWKTTQQMFPWGVTLLLGSGFAIAQAATVSGLSKWLGEQMAVLQGIDDWVICLIITAFVCLMTETTSNTATASLFVPILAELAKTLQIHPLYIMVPPIVAASLAFMLPVATPPNAIAFSYGRISVWDLVKAGWFLNIIGVLVLTLFINTYGIPFFDLGEFPTWANTSLTEPVIQASYTSAPCIVSSTLPT